MLEKSIKKVIQRADQKLKVGCQRIPQKTRIILVILFLISCGLFSLYQTISSLNQMKSNNKTKTNIQTKEIPVQTEQESIYEQDSYNYGTE